MVYSEKRTGRKFISPNQIKKSMEILKRIENKPDPILNEISFFFHKILYSPSKGFHRNVGR